VAALARRHALALLAGTAAGGFLGAAHRRAAAALPVVRIAFLKFGTVSWVLDVVARHRLDAAEGVAIEKLELAGNQASMVALQAGRVDVVVGDLLWVARQRAGGADWSFVPYSTALGAVEVPADSPLRSLDDLRGRRLGIAGSALDKSWLLLRLHSLERSGRDLDGEVEKFFAAPPLLAEQLRAGRLDAVLTYWQFAARMEAAGTRRLIGMDEVIRALGVTERPALVGYIVSENWAKKHRSGFGAFLRACRAAERILRDSDAEWQGIAPLTGAAGAAELAHLRDAFRAGIPEAGSSPRAAERLYEMLAKMGGEALAGPSRTLPRGSLLDGFGS
jgi:NitT/TauT family transport system substrate-binding protein